MSSTPQSFASLVAERKIIICVGSGGVGKTTTAATLALAGARAGRNTLVMTIDPAKRLANALGIAQLDHEERRVDDDKIATGGAAVKGSLYAMMLDQKRAFDDLTARYAGDEKLLQRIRNNRIYQQISTTLTGSHEYAAMAKLYDLAHPRPGERVYDLIVLDTPPTANALDFLDAPEKLVSAIDSPALQWFIKPYLEGNKSFSISVVGFLGATVIKRMAKFVGAKFLADMAEFIGDFNGVIAGFRQRAADVATLLRRRDAAFAVVCSPEALSVEEALYFHGRLRAADMPMGGFIVNRVHPIGPPLPSRELVVEKVEQRPELRGFAPDDVVQVAADLSRTYGDFQALAEIDARQILRLRQAEPGGLCATIPLFDRDIYDVEGLLQVAGHLLAVPSTASAAG